MSGIRISGETSFSQLARALDHGVAEIRSGLRTELEASGREIGRTVFRTGAQPMPGHGGLRVRLANSKAQVAVVEHGSEVEVTVTGNSRDGYDLKKIDETGMLFHPVWGHRPVWVTQHVPAHTFSDAFNAHTRAVEDRLRVGMQKTLDHIAQEASRGQ